MKFQTVFFGLMMLSLLSAFALPRHATELHGSALQTLLIPFSRPVFKIAGDIRDRAQTPQPQDTRDTRDIEQENIALKQQIQEMTAAIEELQQRAGERASLGGFEAFCDRFEVVGADTGLHEAIAISGSGIEQVRVDEPVLSSGAVIALIGRVVRAGDLTAQVRLITDPGFTVTGHFVVYSQTTGAAENKDLQAIITGLGKGQMVIDNLPMEDVRHLQQGDWVVLDDETWPRDLQGIRIGRIDSIEPLARQSLFADIRLAPEQNLMHLGDVWVMTHQR